MHLNAKSLSLPTVVALLALTTSFAAQAYDNSIKTQLINAAAAVAVYAQGCGPYTDYQKQMVETILYTYGEAAFAIEYEKVVAMRKMMGSPMFCNSLRPAMEKLKEEK